MNDWIPDLKDILDDDGCAVVVTVAGVRGSAPRETGAKMIVSGRETAGSIGGGQLEYQCTRIAVKQLRRSGAYKAERLRRRFPLGASCGQCCGGVVDVLFERLSSPVWLEELRRLYGERKPVVLITPLEQTSEKYLVTRDRCLQFETDAACPDEVITEARRMMTGSRSATACGKYLLEPVLQRDFNIAVFGAGHVGTAIVDILSKLDCNVRWIDNRRGILPSGLPPAVTAIESDEPAREVAAMPPGSYFLVLTHSHPLDFDICERILRRGDFAYCGLIGSASKRRRFEKMMRKQELPDALIDRLTCPIGVTGIDSKKPVNIAVAVAAELLRLRDAGSAAIEDNEALPGNVRIL